MQLHPQPPRLATRRVLIAVAALCTLAIWLATRALREPVLSPAANPVGVRALATEEAAPPALPQPDTATRLQASAAEWRPAPSRSGVDASNIYKDAFVLFNALTDAEKKMLRNPKEEADAEAAAALFEKIQPILAKLREAMKADYCDWGVAPIGIDTPLTYISQAHDLGKLALWSAAFRMSSDPGNALEDLQTRGRLGHHLSDVLIGCLVSASFESGAQELLRDRLPSLDPAAQAAAASFLASSTLDADFRRGIEGEASMIQNVTDDFVRRSREERVKVFADISPGENQEKNRALQQELLALFDSPERLAAEVAFIRATEEKAAAALTLPEAGFQAWWKATQAEIASGHPLAAVIIPSIESIHAKAQQRRVERTLFAAGVDVLQNGPAQVARYRDPATSAPLQYVPTPSGFELRATYQAKGKPMTMSFGRPH